MGRTPEQNAAYMRRYRRKKKLEQGGVVTDPHAACDTRILTMGETIRQQGARLREQEGIIAALREELADPLKDIFR